MKKPMKIRKLPVVVEGMRFTEDSAPDVINWIRSHGKNMNWNWFSADNQFIDIVTLEGIMTANLGDIVIKGVNDEFYPCKPDIFEKTYEVINGAEEEAAENGFGS